MTITFTFRREHGSYLHRLRDKFVWGLTNSGLDTVKSMHLDLLSDNTKYLKKFIWKMNVPLKIKIFI
jgi:hypothetical protein